MTYFTNLTNPKLFKFNLRNWRNFRIKNSYSNCELGAWAILCNEDEDTNTSELDETEFLKIFSSGRPIFIYYHGNTMHRGTEHRLKLYDILRKSGYHILTVDYRGFGDSSGYIHNEEEALEDAFVTFNYVKSLAPNSPLFIWGHSLGTGISSLLLKKLAEIKQISSINGLVLEAPFTSVLDTMDHIRFTWPWRRMPFFYRVFKQSLVDEKLTFNSIENLTIVDVPILILHGEDDKILSFKMGLKLFSSLGAAGKVVFFKGFASHLGYGHKHLVRYPELSNLIKEFTSEAILLKTSGQKMVLDSCFN